MREIDLEALRSVLLMTILDGDSIPEMFKKIYKCIKLPLNYFDTSFTLVANAFPRPFYFKAWEEMAQRGEAPESVIVKDNYLHYQQKMYASGKSLIFDYGNCENYPQACGPVTVDGKLVGYMGTMVEDATQESALAANDMISDAISIATRNGNITSTLKRAKIEQLISLGRLDSSTLAIFKASFPPPYLFAVLRSRDSSVSTFSYISNHICTEASGFLSCYKGEHDLFLIKYGIKTGPADNLKEFLTRLSEQYNLHGGISDRFSSLESISIHRKQALLALSVGLQNHDSVRVHEFGDTYCEILNSCILERFAVTSCLQPALANMLKNKEYGKKYESTLKAFFDNQQHSAAVSKKLGIHKNTVLLRLSQIEELTGIDCSDAQQAKRTALQLDLYEAGRKL